MSRPSKLTNEIQARIVQLIMAGCYPDVAAGACGISRASHYSWMKQGREPGLKPIAKYIAYAAAVQEAIDRSEVRLLLKINEFIEGTRPHRRDPNRRVRSRISVSQVVTMQWMLARRFSARWGQESSVDSALEIAGNEQPRIAIQIIHAAPNDEPRLPAPIGESQPGAYQPGRRRQGSE